MHLVKSLGLAVLLAVALVSGALAAAVTYDFSATGNAGAGSGSFTFLEGTGSLNPQQETEFGLTAFSFSFGGGSFGLDDLDPALRVALFDGSQLLGLELGRTGAFSFKPSQAGQLAYLIGGDEVSTSALSFRLRQGQPLPEPGTAVLVLLAAAALWAGRRAATARR